jgi:hypothetical protein
MPSLSAIARIFRQNQCNSLKTICLMDSLCWNLWQGVWLADGRVVDEDVRRLYNGVLALGVRVWL